MLLFTSETFVLWWHFVFNKDAYLTSNIFCVMVASAVSNL